MEIHTGWLALLIRKYHNKHFQIADMDRNY